MSKFLLQFVLIPAILGISCLVSYNNGKKEGRHEKYIEIEKHKREHPASSKYVWNENRDIQYIWTYGPEIHVESVAGGTIIFGSPMMKEATAAELELYIKKKKEHDKQK